MLINVMDSNNINWGNWDTTRIAGGKGDDTITAGIKSLISAGGSGNDIITGSTEKDVIWGDGYDSLKFDQITIDQDDNISGFGLKHTFSSNFFSNSHTVHDGNDTITTGLGDDIIYGGDGDDNIDAGLHNDYVDGDKGNDTIDGGEGENEIHGGEGNDTVSAGAGDDQIYGEDGEDTINAGDGNNTIDGGGHNDTITSGTGDDKFLEEMGTTPLIPVEVKTTSQVVVEQIPSKLEQVMT